MSSISKLKLISSKRVSSTDPIIFRRKKLVSKINEQVSLVKAKIDGTNYTAKKLKYVNDESGNRTQVEVLKRIKEWHWIGDNGKINLAIKYGSKTLDLSKGKNAIETSSMDDLLKTLELVKEAVVSGELDEAITTVSDKVKSSFKK